MTTQRDGEVGGIMDSKQRTIDLKAESARLREKVRQAIADACREAGYDQAGEAGERFWKRIDAVLGSTPEGVK